MTPVGRLRGAFRGPGSVEVGQDCGLPPTQGPSQPGDLRNRAGREQVEDLGDEPASLHGAGVVDRAELLVAVPGQGDLAVRVPGRQLRVQPADLLLGQVLHSDLLGSPDPLARVAFASAVAHDVLLHAAADLVDDLSA